MKKNTIGDYLMIAEIVILGAAETAHLAAAFLQLPFSGCSVLFGCLAGIAAAVGTGFLVFGVRRRVLRGNSSELCKKPGRFTLSEAVPYAILFVLMISQLIFICVGNTVYRGGDMTVETVGSFLAADSVYQVNPMTGQPYSTGIPLRLKILCLPTLYACLCRYMDLSPAVLVYRVVPMVTLLSCYTAFGVLARCLFPEDADMSDDCSQRKKRACFLVVVSLILWVGTYREGMDGFHVLYTGWRGVAIRNAVLLPWLFSLCLRKKWFSVILCILAEACVTWTLYGCGACAAVTLGMLAAQWFCSKVWEKTEKSSRRGREKKG